MAEWILILALNINSGLPRELRDVSVTTIDGFKSKATCESAGKTLASKTEAVVDKARSQAGMTGSKAAAMINFDCVRITK